MENRKCEVSKYYCRRVNMLPSLCLNFGEIGLLLTKLTAIYWVLLEVWEIPMKAGWPITIPPNCSVTIGTPGQ